MEFYKIESPTTKQIFDAIVNKEYVPIEKIVSKAKQTYTDNLTSLQNGYLQTNTNQL